ncbi:MAG TPA: hypothetical protein VGZ47_06200, partial [Gemmataceae bacterium]|nr:hypothetical protein [Gemmataceae bacterium]
MRTMWHIFLTAVVVFAVAEQLRAENQQVQIDIQVLSVLPEGLTKVEFAPASNSGARLVPSSKSAPHCWFGEISEKEKCEWLRKLLAEGHGKVLAEPRLVTFSGQPAKFLCGGQQAVLARLEDSKAPGVDFREVGTSVEVLPTIKNDQTLDLELQWSLTKVNKDLGIETSFGLVPGFTSSSSKTSLELHSGSTFVFCFGWEQINDDPATCSLIFITPHILPSSPVIQASVQELAHVQAGRIAAVLAAEYRQACTAGDKELAAKLGRMALELDPLCFNQAGMPALMPATAVYALPAPMPTATLVPSAPAANERENGHRTPIVPPIRDGETAPDCPEPSEKEIIQALNNKLAPRKLCTE